MKKLRKKDKEILDKYSSILHTAYYSNYIRRVPSYVVDDLLEVWKYLYNKEYKLCRHCSSGILTLCKDIARIYYNNDKKE